MIEIIALHKHWCIADAVKVVINAPITSRSEESSEIKRYGQEFVLLGEKASLFARMSVWYALLYVVVEGYRELKVAFPPLDELLEKPELVNDLRLFRNATFHYQENPLSEKILGFLCQEESEKWIHELNRQLEAFFLTRLPIKEVLKAIEQKDA